MLLADKESHEFADWKFKHLYLKDKNEKKTQYNIYLNITFWLFSWFN
jgi:hypothetical protein